MLKEGDTIRSSGKGYDLIIPRYNHPEVQAIYQEAKRYSGDIQGKEKVIKFAEYVQEQICFEPGWNNQKQRVSLTNSLKERKGVCKERAATLSLLLTLEGIENYYKRGKYFGDRHAWLKVRIDEDDFLVDPSLSHFIDYQLVTEKVGIYQEGENLIISLSD